jgi:host factor-I protein
LSRLNKLQTNKKLKEREAIREMDSTAQNSQNVQDGFLNNLRKDRVNVTIYLMGGVKLTGKIRSFDKFSLVLESGNLEQLIFKHAISTISVPRGSFHHARPESHQQQSQPVTTAPPSPSTPVIPPGGGSSSASSGS